MGKEQAYAGLISPKLFVVVDFRPVSGSASGSIKADGAEKRMRVRDI